MDVSKRDIYWFFDHVVDFQQQHAKRLTPFWEQEEGEIVKFFYSAHPSYVQVVTETWFVWSCKIEIENNPIYVFFEALTRVTDQWPSIFFYTRDPQIFYHFLKELNQRSARFFKYRLSNEDGIEIKDMIDREKKKKFNDVFTEYLRLCRETFGTRLYFFDTLSEEYKKIIMKK